MRTSFLLPLFLISAMLVGCGGSDVLLQPNYSNREITSQKIARANIKISQVVDNRKVDERTIGSARVGAFNRLVPYHTAVPFNEFVKNVLDSLFTTAPNTVVVPAVVYLDTFAVGEGQSLFSESGFVHAKMYFGVPVARDSLMYFRAGFDSTVYSGVDVTDMLEPLIYASVVECGKQFVEKMRTMNTQFVSMPNDSISLVAVPATPENIAAQSIEASPLKQKITTYSNIGAMYSVGGKMQRGIRLFYNMLGQKDSSRTMTGGGFNLEILSINNKTAFIKGTMVSYGGNFLLREMFSDEPTSGYFGLQGTLTFGNETIDYGSHKESSFYLGPFLRETVGVSLNKKAFLEAGLYEIALFGSKMLPSDVGFSFGVSFGL